VQVDVRIISATWAPLEEAILARGFRQDLFHRLAVGTIQLPTLADRKSDIGPLTAHVLQARRLEVGERELTPAALGRLMTYDWPGNVRELNNVVLRAAVLSDNRWIQADDIEAALSSGRRTVGRLSPRAAKALVAECGGSVAAAARRCGVPRSTFRGWLRRERRSDLRGAR
jgi:DNA-binding NtrC family response regulator